MRFTAHKDREGGAFKNTQCKLVGWELPPEEEARVAAIQENEITLRVMPIALHVKLLRPTKNFRSSFGEGVLRLKPEYKIWSRHKDLNAKVRRKGFEVVPDFGGTAHAYCGENLEVATGDLLEWHRHQTHESMLRACNIKSRVRDVANLLIVQPYSPVLFRQGVLPGPDLLLRRQRGDLSRS